MFRYITSLPSPAWEQEFPRRTVVLGSTGSIGVNALRVIEARPDLFRVEALAGGRNAALLAEQARKHRPPLLGVLDAATADAVTSLLPRDYRPCIEIGTEGYKRLASLPEVGTVLSAQAGSAGLAATAAAVEAGKVVCLANKESLVLAGNLLRERCARSGAVILPVDSEHNAVFQLLRGRDPASVSSVVLTASGGPFRGRNREQLACVTPEQALRHPSWTMGAKITIDSATLMNKGLEVIEAYHLYGLPEQAVGVLVHPGSLVHALAVFTDGSITAHLGSPDMRMPIAYCLAWPRCLDVGIASLDLARIANLTFEEPDLASFPCLALARRALQEGQGKCVTLNAANECAVEAFLHKRIGFLDIPMLIEHALERHQASEPRSIEEVEELDRATRRVVGARIDNL